MEITENVISAFKQELINDGLIKEGKKYEIEFSAGEFRINGKKQPEEVYAKYSELYEELTRRVITNETRFQIIDK